MRKIPVLVSFLLIIYMNNHQVFAEKPPNDNLYKVDWITLHSGSIKAQSEQPDYRLIYDTLLTTLEPSIQQEIIKHYGYLKQFEDAKFLSITRELDDYIVKVQVTTFVHAHDPPYGQETMTFKIDPFGVKKISSQHEGAQLEKEINEFYLATLSDIKQSFNLNLESYSSYTYNQLQYQAEMNNEFKSLFTIADEIATDILLPERKIPNKNVIDPVTFIKDKAGYMLFKRSEGTNVIYQVQKKDGKWIVVDKNSKQGKKMDDLIPWYIWGN